MANAMVSFRKGLLQNLPVEKKAGTFYVATDERSLYLDVDETTRIRLGDFQEFATVAALQANVNPSTTALYYVDDINCLAKWNGDQYVQINTDTGATSVEVVGKGNAVSAASYDATTRKLTLTMDGVFATQEYVGDIPDGYTETSIIAYINKKAQETLNYATGDISDKVTTLIGDDDNKSVRTIANEELVAQLIPETAQESLDTLQEIAAWIQAHPDDASEMNLAIGKLQDILDGIGGDGEKATVVDYIADVIDGLDVEDNAVTKQFVTAVNEINGKVVVSRAALVADDIPELAQSKITNLTSNISDINEALNNLDSNKADKSTSLAGYGITDAYTKTETYTQEQVNTAIQEALAWSDF